MANPPPESSDVRLDRPSPARQSRAVDLSNYLRMDPHLLVGLANTELRNRCESLEDLVKTHHLDEAALIAKLANAGYRYEPDQMQFR